MTGCQRVPVNAWLNAVETETGPLPPELRHLCLTLGRFLYGDGTKGCFPSTRTIAQRIGVHRSTVSRWLHLLHKLGWLDLEPHTRQFGRPGARYFPAVPLAHPFAPIQQSIGASRRANAANGVSDGAPERANPANCAGGDNGAQARIIGARAPKIGAPGRARSSFLNSLPEKSAASPSPADAGSAARPQDENGPPILELPEELIPDIARLHDDGLDDAAIASRLRAGGCHLANTAMVRSALERLAQHRPKDSETQR